MSNTETVNVRYMVDDVDEAIGFYTKVLGFELISSAAPAFADVRRGNLRLLLAGPARRPAWRRCWCWWFRPSISPTRKT